MHFLQLFTNYPIIYKDVNAALSENLYRCQPKNELGMSEGSLEAEASLFGGRVVSVTVTGADYLLTNIQNLNLSQLKNHLIIGEIHNIPTDPV